MKLELDDSSGEFSGVERNFSKRLDFNLDSIQTIWNNWAEDVRNIANFVIEFRDTIRFPSTLTRFRSGWPTYV